MTLTENYGFKKPGDNDYVSVAHLNENMDLLDLSLRKVSDKVDKAAGVLLVILSASAWTGSSAPYSQTVAVEGITAEDEPILVRALSDGATETVQKAYNKAFGILAAGTGTTADGSVTFKVYQKPTTDLTVGLKGV